MGFNVQNRGAIMHIYPHNIQAITSDCCYLEY
jgi:hypothetical protein